MSVDGMLEKAFRNRAFSKFFFVVERKMKEWLFDCQSCGNCVLSHTGFICPMRCPKDQRNGPCGGAMEGMCEVDMSKRCVWDEVWESTIQLDRVDLLTSNYEGPPIGDWAEPLPGKTWSSVCSKGHPSSRLFLGKTNLYFVKAPGSFCRFGATGFT